MYFREISLALFFTWLSNCFVAFNFDSNNHIRNVSNIRKNLSKDKKIYISLSTFSHWFKKKIIMYFFSNKNVGLGKYSLVLLCVKQLSCTYSDYNWFPDILVYSQGNVLCLCHTVFPGSLEDTTSYSCHHSTCNPCTLRKIGFYRRISIYYLFFE